jgi:hypothetical protein
VAENSAEQIARTNKVTKATPAPPGAFTQGVGTVYQFTGVIVFLAFFFVCCFSSLLSKDTATQMTPTHVNWHGYTAQRAITICMPVGALLGMALAGVGLGLQAQRRRSAAMAVFVCAVGLIFWCVHAVFFALVMRSVLLTLLGTLLALVFFVLTILSIGAWREMLRHPPPAQLPAAPPEELSQRRHR